MNKVTARYSGRGRKQRLSIHVDSSQLPGQDAPGAMGSVPIALNDIDTVPEHSALKPETSRCLKAAVRFLKYRPRSEFEVRERLRHHGYESQCVDAAIVVLKEKKLIDDRAFARFWVENRDSFSPRSQRLIKTELRQKGIDGDIIDQAVAITDDIEGAYRAAQQKARGLSHLDYDTFSHRLSAYLQRRGFGYTIVNEAVTRVWSERSETVPDYVQE
jgi:regulatory protein